MTEQVIDIRDRIEKMRNQMTVPNSQDESRDKKKPANDVDNIKVSSQIQNGVIKENQELEEQIMQPNILKKKESPEVEVSKIKTAKNQNLEKNKSFQKNAKVREEKPKSYEEINYTKYSEKQKPQNESYKKYDDYQNDRVVDENKQSVKLDEKQPFPQFSLNVSNPISWKLMLLIMLMQLLTNMMLVIVLYLK